MKNQIVLLLLTFLCLSAWSQSKDWKQINTANKTGIHLLYQATDGTLFGTMQISNSLAISKDNAKTWVIMEDLKLSYNIFFIRPFREDKFGTLIYFYENKVYIYDKVNTKFDLLISLGSYEYINDIGILYNSDILISTDNKIFKYSSDGQLMQAVNWQVNYMTFLMSDVENGKNFVKYSDSSGEKIAEILPNLSLNNIIDISDKHEIQYVRLSDRIFTNESYSDDGGKNWNKLQFPTNIYARFLNIGADNKLYFFTNTGIFISADMGNTFEAKQTPIEYLEYASATVEGNFVLGAFDGFCSSEIYIATDLEPTFKKIENEIGDYYAFYVYPGINENISYKNCYHILTKNSLQNWDTLKASFDIDYDYIDELYHLSNGDILGKSRLYKLYLSSDNGKNWKKIAESFNFSDFRIIEKQNVLYAVGNNLVRYSTDLGLSWDTYNHDGLLYKGSGDVFDFSNKYDLYYYDWTDQFQLFRLNIKTKVKDALNISSDLSVINLVTSFDGKVLFAHIIDNSGHLLYTSYDYGKTFDIKPIPRLDPIKYNTLKIDHLNNLYIVDESTLHISKDNGTSWQNITPDFPELVSINDIEVSYDNYIYLGTTGMGILKYETQLAEPKNLKVVVYDDLNFNCHHDANEPRISVGKVVVDGDNIRALDPQGEANFYIHTSKVKVELDVDKELYERCQDFYEIDLPTNYTELAIPLKTKKYCTTLRSSIAASLLRRCFDNTYYGQVCNFGNTEAKNVETRITLDPYFDFVSASLPIISHANQELVLSVPDLKSGECSSYNVKVNINCDATLGQEHCVEVSSKTSSSHCNEAHESPQKECQNNVGSYDPNDKAIFVNGVKDMTYVEQGDRVEYMIRFQNTGTDTAFTVKIDDPLSSKFDYLSVTPVAASHPYTWSIDNGTLHVIFNDILLVDSFRNEPLSHGFIKFEIKLSEDAARSESLSNIAGIYFDFNDPVITNEVITPIGKPVHTDDSPSTSLRLFPNPVEDVLNIVHSNPTQRECKLLIYNENGQLLIQNNVKFESNIQVDTKALSTGFYIIQLVDQKSETKAKFIKL